MTTAKIIKALAEFDPFRLKEKVPRASVRDTVESTHFAQDAERSPITSKERSAQAADSEQPQKSESVSLKFQQTAFVEVELIFKTLDGTLSLPKREVREPEDSDI